MNRIYTIIIIGIMCFSVYSQDLIYTVKGYHQEERVALDSIMVENLTNHTKIVFGPLPVQDEYQVILGTGLQVNIDSLLEDKSIFSLAANTPGMLQLKYNESRPAVYTLEIFNSAGKQVHLSNGKHINPGSILNIRLGIEGIYLIRITSKGRSESFCGVGARVGGDFDVHLSGASFHRPVLKGTGPSSEFNFNIGDSLRISAFKKDYYAWPVVLTITDSEVLEFHFEISTVTTTGISDAYVALDEQTTVVTEYNEKTGELRLFFEGQAHELRPGNILTVDLDSTYVLRKVVKVNSSDDTTVMTTIPAYLNELFIDKAFKINTGYMAPNSELKSTSSPEEITGALTDEEGFIHPYEFIYRDQQGNLVRETAWDNHILKGLDENVSRRRLLYETIDLSKSLITSDDGVVKFFSHDSELKLSLDFCGEFEFDPSLGTVTKETKIKRSDIVKYDYWLEGNADLVYLLTLILTEDFEKDPDEQLLIPLFEYTVTFMIGAIPVSITFDNNIFYDYKLDASAHMEANWGFEYHHTLKLGASYSKETNEFSLIKESDPTLDFHPLKLQGEVQTYARVEVFPRIEVLLYNFFGPYFDLTPFLDGQFNLAGEFSTFNGELGGQHDRFVAWDSRFGVGFDFRVGAKMEGFWGLIDREFGPEVFHLLSDPRDHTIPSRAIYEAPYQLKSMSEIPDEIEPGEAVLMRFKVTNYSLFDGLNDKPVCFCPIYLEGDGSFSKQIVFSDLDGEAEVEWYPDGEGKHNSYARIYNADHSLKWECLQSVFVTGDFSGSEGSFTDSRDGEIYNWVKIGDQIWMTENLRYIPDNEAYGIAPGSQPDIDLVTDYRDSYIYPYYYVYNYQGINPEDARRMPSYSTYGVLYNFKAATETCPESQGWYLPSDSDWKELETYIATRYGYRKDEENQYWENVGRRLKSADWGGTNDFGFNALPGGLRNRFDGSFECLGSAGYWWSSTPWVSDCSYSRYMSWDNHIYRRHIFNQYGASVRCIHK